MSDKKIDLSEIPEITEEQMKRATLRVGGEPVTQGEGLPSYSTAGQEGFDKAEACS